MQHTHEIPLSTFGYASLAEVKFRGGLPGAGRQAQPRDVQRGMRGHAGGWDAWRFDPCVLREVVRYL